MSTDLPRPRATAVQPRSEHAEKGRVAVGQTHAFYHGIQDLRGWAALIVVMYHVHVLFQKEKYFGASLFAGFFEFGHRGVELFFVISGFLMAMLMNNPLGAPRAGAFLLARARRIYVPYLPVLFLLTGACLVIPGACPAAYTFDLRVLLTNVTLWPRPDLDTFVPVVAWTLSHEIFFYLMVTLAIRLGGPGRLLLTAWLGLSAALALAGVEVAFPWGFILSPYNMAFGFGMLAYQVIQFPRFTPLAGGARLIGAALFLALGMAEAWAPGLSGASGPYGALVQRLLTVAFFAASFLLVAGHARAPARRMKLLGDASYSLYLVHYPVMVVAVMVVSRVLRNVPLYVLFCGVALTGVIAGIVFFYLVERPGLRLFGRKRNA